MIFFIFMCHKTPGIIVHYALFPFSKLLIKIPIMLGSKSHLLLFTSAYLHICSPSHLLTFTFAHIHISLITFFIFLSSYLVTSRLLIFPSSNIHIFTIFSLSRLLEIFLSFRPWVVPARVQEMWTFPTKWGWIVQNSRHPFRTISGSIFESWKKV